MWKEWNCEKDIKLILSWRMSLTKSKGVFDYIGCRHVLVFWICINKYNTSYLEFSNWYMIKDIGYDRNIEGNYICIIWVGAGQLTGIICKWHIIEWELVGYTIWNVIDILSGSITSYTNSNVDDILSGSIVRCLYVNDI